MEGSWPGRMAIQATFEVDNYVLLSWCQLCFFRSNQGLPGHCSCIGWQGDRNIVLIIPTLLRQI